MKQMFALYFLFLSFGCSSIKNTPKIEKYTKLDSITVKSLMKEYSIDIPENWDSYLEAHYHLSHSPEGLLINRKTINASLFILKKSIEKCKCNNIDELTTCFVKKKKKTYKNFNYDLVKGKHPLYGRYNFVIYKKIYFNKNYTTLNALILKDQNYYIITYNALSEKYKIYADDIVKIIHSFKIKE